MKISHEIRKDASNVREQGEMEAAMTARHEKQKKLITPYLEEIDEYDTPIS